MLDRLEIKQFRCFDTLVVEQLRRVNLIVGKNNVGKSTLLEAIRQHVRPGGSGNSPDQAPPLRRYSDHISGGMAQVLEIVSGLVQAKGGIALFDEIEKGIHHTQQEDVWRMIIQLAKALDLQVFATTHSWDCIAGFQEAIDAEPEETGALVRLTRKGKEIVATTYDQYELAIAVRQQIELR